MKSCRHEVWVRTGAFAFAAIVAVTALRVNAAETLLPGEPATKPAMAPDPFPDALSAFVWRNWFVVPKARLASIVGAKSEELQAMATEMGLPKQPAILPEWHRRGYITVLRRNWHLLPYEQILELLQMSREELAFSLQEDDFLYVKLGNLKPKCDRLMYDAARVAATSAARKHIGKILAEEGIDAAAPEEPRFSFIRAFDKPDPALKVSTKNNSPFDFRMIFSYFADYADPLGDPEISSYPEGLLQRLAAQGVNAVWLHTVLRTLAKDPAFPEFGEGSEKRMANLRKLVARAGKYGIRVFLYMNEPRCMPQEFFEKPGRAAMRGVQFKRIPTMYAMCTSNPEVRRWIRDSLAKVFTDVPGLGGIFTITASENLSNCASHHYGHECPNCAKRTEAEIIADINNLFIEGMTKGNPKAEALVWDWAWKENLKPEILSRLVRNNIRVMAVSEHGMNFTRGGVTYHEDDYSISVVGPGRAALDMWDNAHQSGLKCVAKVQANCSWEIAAFPYLPVMDLVAEHAFRLSAVKVDGVMLSWSLGCCPAPNLRVYRDLTRKDSSSDDVLNLIATDLYGKKALSTVRRAWHAFSTGFSEYPFSCGVAYVGPQHWGPANPLYLKPTGYSATMVGIPYDAINGWKGPYPADVFIGQWEKVAAGFAEGCRLFDTVANLVPPEKRAAVEREANMFHAECLHFASVADQCRFVVARNAYLAKGATAAEKVARAAEMKSAARRECARAKEMLERTRADSRIGYESSNHYFYTPQDLREKIISCRAVIDAAL